MRNLIFLMCLFVTQLFLAQNNNTYLRLISTSNSNKTKVIKYFDEAALDYVDSLDEVNIYNDFEIVYFDDFTKGFEVYNDSVDLSSMQYKLNGFIFNTFDTTYHQSIMRVDFGGDGYGYYKNCHIKDLNYIKVNNKIKPYINAGIYFSLFSTLVISPLVSYDFKTKNIRQKKYNTWMMGSLISSAIFISIRIPLKDKTYQLKDKNGIKANWKIAN